MKGKKGMRKTHRKNRKVDTVVEIKILNIIAVKEIENIFHPKVKGC